MTNVAESAVDELRAKHVDYVQLSIDIKKEIINLEEKGKVAVGDLPKKVPEDQPRYHLFEFKHTHEGDYMQSIGKTEAK